MAITIGANIASLLAQRTLATTSSELMQVQERLSSGMRINRASDDAAGLAIASGLNAERRVFDQGIRNLNDGISLLNIADSTTEALTDIVTHIKELATQAANGSLSSKQRSALDLEAQALSAEYFRISRSAKFNDISLFDGSLQELRLQAGFSALGSTLGGVMGNGSFNQGTSYYANSTSTTDLTLGDINADGMLDLVTTGVSSGDGYATVRLGLGDGTFAAATSYLAETADSYVAILDDINGDGSLDLLTAGQGDDSNGYVTVRFGAGDGSFGAAVSYQTAASGNREVVLGDLNGDGYIDLVAAGPEPDTGGSGGYATVRLGMGNGTFGAATSYLQETFGTWGLSMGDLNGDGRLDIVTAGSSAADGYATIRLGNGDGTFSSALSYQTESWISHLALLKDINGDDELDLITTGRSDSSDGYTTVRLGIGDGTFSSARSYAAETDYSYEAVIGDVNGDGIPDLITAGRADAGDGYAGVRLGLGDGTFGAATSYTTESGVSASLTLGDLNNDGVLDLVTSGQSDALAGYATVRLGSTRAGVAPLLPFSLTTASNARWAMSLMDQKLEQLASQRASIGSFQSRTTVAINTLQIASQSYSAAESRIRDADIAEESANHVRLMILRQATVSILAQANQQPALTLTLLST